MQLFVHSVFISVFVCCTTFCVSDVTIQVGMYQRQEPEADLSTCFDDKVNNTLRCAFLNELVLETVAPFIWGSVLKIKAHIRDVPVETEGRIVLKWPSSVNCLVQLL